MKKFMKKITAALLAVLLIAGLAACSGAPAADGEDAGKLKIVTTIFPEYDWVREILGDKAAEAEVTLLMDSGVDLHNYQPTADDIIKISTCDMFIYVGGESDKWAEDALKEAANPDMAVVNLLEELGDAAKTEETVEGMETEDEEGEEALDEHVWLSLKNAETLCAVIAETLCALDGESAGTYEANARAYIARLEALDGEYQSAVDAAGTKTLLFGDRFPFRYLTDDYGLAYYAAFSGCSAETEASFETVAFLAGKVDELGLSCVMTIEGSDDKIAQTIIDNTAGKDQTILALDSMQSVTAADVENGAGYLSIMIDNLDVLRRALA